MRSCSANKRLEERSGGVRVQFRVRFQALKVPIFGGFPVENPTNKATALKALLRRTSAFLSNFAFSNPIFCSRRFSADGGDQEIRGDSKLTTRSKYTTTQWLLSPPPCADIMSVVIQASLLSKKGSQRSTYGVAICAKAFRPPKSPETTPSPKFSRKSGVAPKSPRNSHWIHTKRHTKPHWIPLSSPEFPRNFPEFAQIPSNPLNFRKIRGGEEFTQPANMGGVVKHCSVVEMTNACCPCHWFLQRYLSAEGPTQQRSYYWVMAAAPD